MMQNWDGQKYTMRQTEKFFRDKCPSIIGARNAPEREKRMTWLSEGILCNMLHGLSALPASMKEIDMYTDFLAWMIQQDRCQRG